MFKNIGEIILKYRFPILIVFVCITAFFAFQISHVKIATVFSHLLPQKHPYVKVHNEFRKSFGGVNVVSLVVEVKEGTIFHIPTLEKIRRITQSLDLMTAVNHYQLCSIAHKKIKDIRASEWGIESKPIMWPEVPRTVEEIEVLKKNIYSNPLVYGNLVSFDDKAALITADFFEEKLDYGVFIKEINKIRQDETDSNTNIYIAGEPLVYGIIYGYLNQTLIIFAVTILVMGLLLLIYTRKVRFTVLPFISAMLSWVWGIGFMGLIGYNLDPLLLVVPLLICARILSHSVQMNERYVEEYEKLGQVKPACEATIQALFVPGLAGILTDAAGILVIIFVAIQILQELAITCCFWALSSIGIVLVLNPILLYYFPIKAGVAEKEESPGLLDRLLAKLGVLSFGKRGWVILGVAVIISIFGFICSTKLTVGDTNPGTSLLWPDSVYNQDVKHINSQFPGVDQLYLVVKGKEKDVIKSPSVLQRIESLQRYMEHSPLVGGTQSIVNAVVTTVNMNIHEGDPHWAVIPPQKNDVAMLFYMYLSGGADPGDFDKFTDYGYKDANIVVYYKNHLGDTIRDAIQRARDFLNSMPPLEEVEFQLAGGLIGCIAAVNEVVTDSQILLLVLAFSVTIIFCSISFRSLVAGILLNITLGLSNLLVFAYMAIMHIGMSVNTLPVASIAIGIGVDYGIYLFSRIREEYEEHENLESAISIAISTTGKAIALTAFTVILGVVFWAFSSIKFQAEMGFLLSLVTLFHLLGTLIFLPALVYLIKPKFICRVKAS